MTPEKSLYSKVIEKGMVKAVVLISALLIAKATLANLHDQGHFTDAIVNDELLNELIGTNGDMTFNEFEMFSFDSSEGLGSPLEELGRSGDVVGNGQVLEDDLNGGPLFIDEQNKDEKNKLFDQFLEEYGIDPENAMSGDVVGNGGGLHEARAYFYYHSLSKHIVAALEQMVLPFHENEKAVLRKILSAMPLFGQEGKLVFLDDREHPQFFETTGLDPAPRIAKTGFGMDYPIFINRNLVYSKLDQDDRFWMSTLIHELGHQVGVANHTFLESLGAKVVSVADLNKSSLSTIFTPGQVMRITVHNYDFMDGLPDLAVSYGNQLTEVKDWNKESLRKVCGHRYFFGLQLENAHWKTRRKAESNSSSIEAGYWATVKCFDSFSGVFYNHAKDMTLAIKVEDDKIKTTVQFE